MAINDLQCKKCRRAGEKLFLKGEKCFSAQCPMIKKNFPPGVHGQKGRGRISEYGRQLIEKQKTKWIYGIQERQFKKYFEEALKKKGNTSELFFQKLETRIDNIVYRLGLAGSRRQARQLVSHGHFKVNGRKVTIPSHRLKVGDTIAVRPKSQESPIFQNYQEKLKEREVPAWLSFELEDLTGKITNQPKLEDIETGIDWRMIVEFYSR